MFPLLSVVSAAAHLLRLPVSQSLLYSSERGCCLRSVQCSHGRSRMHTCRCARSTSCSSCTRSTSSTAPPPLRATSRPQAATCTPRWRVRRLRLYPRSRRGVGRPVALCHAPETPDALDRLAGAAAMQVPDIRTWWRMAVAGAVGALYGPLHGGANEAVLRMLTRIGKVSGCRSAHVMQPSFASLALGLSTSVGGCRLRTSRPSLRA